MKVPFSIQTENLHCGYGNRFSLQKINLRIGKGEFVAIVGPNGSGKTTLFRGLTGMLPATSGKILIEGEALSALSYRERAQRMAVVNQTVDAEEITVEDYVLLGRLPYREPFRFFENAEDLSIAEKSMSLTGILTKRDKYMNRLSGGERQLAAIARALAQETEIILLDEPTAHLDIAHQIRILNLTRSLNKEKGITVLLVIHDLNLASEFSDRLILLSHGNIHSKGTPEEVFTNEHIETVYGAKVLIQPNPLSGKPYIFPLKET